VSIVGQLSKIESEIIGKIGSLQQSIDDLQAQLANVALTDEQAASVQAVIDGVNALDNIVPDA
jgi:cystathionine beta-lyase family protein involved in aluminum resistance